MRRPVPPSDTAIRRLRRKIAMAHPLQLHGRTGLDRQEPMDRNGYQEWLEDQAVFMRPPRPLDDSTTGIVVGALPVAPPPSMRREARWLGLAGVLGVGLAVVAALALRVVEAPTVASNAAAAPEPPGTLARTARSSAAEELRRPILSRVLAPPRSDPEPTPESKCEEHPTVSAPVDPAPPADKASTAKGSVPEPPTAAPPPEEPAAPAAPPFNKAAAVAAMSAAASVASGCGSPKGPFGPGAVSVTVSPSG